MSEAKQLLQCGNCANGLFKLYQGERGSDIVAECACGDLTIISAECIMPKIELEWGRNSKGMLTKFHDAPTLEVAARA